MWFREYRDYKKDKPLIKYKVEPGHGIVGCEMHDLNGWGNTLPPPHKKKKMGLWRTFFSLFHPKVNKHE